MIIDNTNIIVLYVWLKIRQKDYKTTQMNGW